jgi:hypothetical protein
MDLDAERSIDTKLLRPTERTCTCRQNIYYLCQIMSNRAMKCSFKHTQ